MRIAIVGAGAIGGLLGAKLSRSGNEISLIARGAHLKAMQEHGLKLIDKEGSFTVHPFCTDNPADIGVVDVVIVTLKAHQLPAIAWRLAPLLGKETMVISAMNGLPWWYFQRHGGELEGTELKSLDPDGVISQVISPERIIGCEVLPSAEIIAPGVVKHTWGTTFPMGELSGENTMRIQRFAKAMKEAGFKAPVSDNIRRDIWVKLMGNMAFNPISTLTRATLVEMAEDHSIKTLVEKIMREALTICDKLGLEIGVTIERRIEGARKVGHHKTSMLQDLEAGKPLELECMVGAALELGEMLDVDMPHTRSVYAMTQLLATTQEQANAA